MELSDVGGTGPSPDDRVCAVPVGAPGLAPGSAGAVGSGCGAAGTSTGIERSPLKPRPSRRCCAGEGPGRGASGIGDSSGRGVFARLQRVVVHRCGDRYEWGWRAGNVYGGDRGDGNVAQGGGANEGSSEGRSGEGAAASASRSSPDSSRRGSASIGRRQRDGRTAGRSDGERERLRGGEMGRWGGGGMKRSAGSDDAVSPSRRSRAGRLTGRTDRRIAAARAPGGCWRRRARATGECGVPHGCRPSGATISRLPRCRDEPPWVEREEQRRRPTRSTRSTPPARPR